MHNEKFVGTNPDRRSRSGLSDTRFRWRVGFWLAVGLLVGISGVMVWTASPDGKPAPGVVASRLPPKPGKANPLAGTWKLIAIEERDARGNLVTPLDYGDEPLGILMYDTAGNMSVHAMRRNRPKLPSDDVHLAPPDLAKTAFTGYGAYFGTYEVNEEERLVIHHVQGSLIPNWEGSDQRRRFTLAGDRLILEPPAIQAAGQKRTRRLTWQRVAAPTGENFLK